ncbi:LysE family translocator [Motiliproteus coralliicola]|uniref:LysE family translocator n=1 Tax=Motiliproteus coralliicola TaxID=2283196 RepID=A0A369WLS8_9GAMM|nr:LysE family translocator [Motiliproteus coralliicola]RDE23030.1 LysE family translocator [Motiliproteus coralliicola]
MVSFEFLVTSLVVVLLPGTGVLFTVSTGLTMGKRASIFAALGCTAGIIPHLVASIFGLAAILHASSVAFEVLRYIGVAYLAYLAWAMWKESGVIALDNAPKATGASKIFVRAFLINILNPKLSIFFLAFIPQFVPPEASSAVLTMLLLSAIFMGMTLAVFIVYGLFSDFVRSYLSASPTLVQWIQRSFSGVFVAMGAKLAMVER